MINVTKSYLPNIEKYKKYIDKIFATNRLTNNGPLVQELEEKLSEYLGINNIILIQNGTLALQIAYKLLGLTGEVITTPFSYVATTSSLVWERLKPIHVDIDQASLNIDVTKIESAINENTSAIVPVHVYGNACLVEEICSIAQKNNISVIYDAAHAFGNKYKNKSLLNYGDISILSFHAAKFFHTIEGGALIIRDDELYHTAKKMINFGFDQGDIKSIGINAKMNEFQAAMGLCNLNEIDNIIYKNKSISDYYKQRLEGFVEFQLQNKYATNNYAYFPIILKDEKELYEVQKKLNKLNIYPRRYFYPSLNNLPYLSHIQNKNSISEDIANRILCLPIYSDLPKNIQKVIIDTILHSIK